MSRHEYRELGFDDNEDRHPLRKRDWEKLELEHWDEEELAERAAEMIFNEEASNADYGTGWPRDIELFRDGESLGVFSVEMRMEPSFSARGADYLPNRYSQPLELRRKKQ